MNGEPNAGSIMGRATDQTGASLPGVTVELSRGAVHAMAVTDARGEYRLDDVMAGDYLLTFGC